ncbi:MAG: hypothetical protein AAFX10_15295 [Pseudomonadota bacterium]
MISRGTTSKSPLMQAVAGDKSIPIDERAVELWMADLDRRSRWIIRPLLQGLFIVILYTTWAFKRLPLPQFRAHGFLQRTICFFCKHFVSPEANELIIRHYTTESNLLNFLLENAGPTEGVEPIELYPQKIDDMLEHSFVKHDQELFRLFYEYGEWDADSAHVAEKELKWTLWRPIEVDESVRKRRWTQVLDFETSHALFMALFCFLLTAEEYRDAINGFNLDQSIAIRVGQVIGDPTVVELAYNKYPHYLVGPGNLAQRFLMHGFFTEYLHARLEAVRTA